MVRVRASLGRLLIMVGLSLSLLPVASAAQSANAAQNATLEARVRAAFLFNFARFTQWPELRATAQQDFIFCVSENPELAQVLSQTVAGKQLEGRSIRVEEISGPVSELPCQLLYLPELSESTKQAWLEQLGEQAVLTVSEGRDFARQGGMVGFHLVDRRLRFTINPAAVHHAGMQMSSRLLSLADIEDGNR